MSSLLNNASFIFNPAGSIISYQEDKVYSVLPNDGSVDGVVGGNSGGGTRVNQQGYVEPVPANLVGYSSDLSNAYWTKRGFSQLSTTEIAPDGSLTAYKVQENNTDSNPGVVVLPSITPQGACTFFVWLKANSNVSFALSTVGNSVGTTINVTTSWQLFQVTQTLSSPANGPHIGGFSTIPQGSGIVLYIWHPQLNIGSTTLPYQPTTDRLGYPPIDYKNGKGKLLQEPQRTNTATYSEDLTNGVWDKTNVSITSNNIVSPDGTQNADRVTRTNTSSTYFYNSNTSTSSNRANSIFLKKGTIDQATILGNSYSSGTYATFNLSNGTIINSAGCTPFIEQYNDGWYRCGIIQTNGVNYVLLVTLNGYTNETVTNGEYLYAWGGQSELGGFPTSYIPTTSATVTRAANDVVFNSPGPTKAFATKPGVILYDFDFYNFADGASYETFLYNSGTTGGDYFYFAKLAGTGQIYWDGNNSGGYFYAGQFVPKQGKNKVAWYFTNTNSYWYVNGSLLYTGTYFDTTYFNSMQTYAVPGNNFAVNTFASIPNTSSVSQAQVQAWTNFNSGSGGNISYYGPYTIHTFTGSATFTPSFNGEVEVLVVAGGGGGGGRHAGGGGAGGLLYNSSFGVAAGSGITVTVGAGGAASPYGGKGGNGSNSSFGGLTSIGGGGGGGYSNGGPTISGSNGGSGGGGGGAFGLAGGNGIGGLGIIGQGNNGGDPSTGPYGAGGFSGGGGGGAGTVGGNVIDPDGGDGGNGLPYSISGFSTYYAGGGGGAGDGNVAATGGTGGLGGGGNGTGAYYPAQGTAGTPNTGGGGGGSRDQAGMAGGSGIVIVRYLT